MPDANLINLDVIRQSPLSHSLYDYFLGSSYTESVWVDLRKDLPAIDRAGSSRSKRYC